MPRIPTYRAKQLPSGNVGAAPVSLDVASQGGGEGIPGRAEAQMFQGLENLGRGVSDFGQKMHKLEQSKLQLADNKASVQVKQLREQGDIQYADWKAKNPPEKWAEGRSKIDADINARINSLEDVSDQWRSATAIETKFHNETSQLMATTEGFTAAAKRDLKIAEDYYEFKLGTDGPDADTTKEAYAIMIDSQDKIGMDPNVQARENEIRLIAGTQTYEGVQRKVFKDMVAGVKLEIAKQNPDGTMVHDAEARAKKFDNLRDEIQTSTLVSEDDRQKALQSLNQYEKTLNGRAEQVSLQNTINYYDENEDRLFNNEMGRDETDEFKFHDGDRKTGSTARAYGDYIEGAADIAINPVPYDTKEGVESMLNAVLAYSMKSIDSKTARDDIYAPALLDKNVTKSTTQWALGMIRRPLPPAFAENLKGVVDANYDIQRVPYKFRDVEDTEAAAVNRSLMQWAGENTTMTTDADGREIWKTPTVSQLEEQSALYRDIIKKQGIDALGGIAPPEPDADLEELGMADEVIAPLTAEEYNAVPSGAWYQHPDDPEGELRKKP